MRKQFDTLAAVVRNELVLNPLTGALFVFCNRRRNRVKILYWQHGGFMLLAKRLERGTFAWPQIVKPYLEMSAEQLALLLAGIDVKEFRRRRWYQHVQ
jgi:transposase